MGRKGERNGQKENNAIRDISIKRDRVAATEHKRITPSYPLHVRAQGDAAEQSSHSVLM